MDLPKRQTWNNLNPVARKPENSKDYNRNKTRNWKREISLSSNSGCFCASIHLIYLSMPQLYAFSTNARSCMTAS